jgi:hypothetical protein
MKCIWCGRDNVPLEEHHIIPRIDGGSDDPDNKEPRCVPCHKFRHAELRILKALEGERQDDQNINQHKRMAVLEHRLEVLRSLNTPELIRERGTYQTYWIDETTRYFPHRIVKKPISKEQLDLCVPVPTD